MVLVHIRIPAAKQICLWNAPHRRGNLRARECSFPVLRPLQLTLVSEVQKPVFLHFSRETRPDPIRDRSGCFGCRDHQGDHPNCSKIGVLFILLGLVGGLWVGRIKSCFVAVQRSAIPVFYFSTCDAGFFPPKTKLVS